MSSEGSGKFTYIDKAYMHGTGLRLQNIPLFEMEALYLFNEILK